MCVCHPTRTSPIAISLPTVTYIHLETSERLPEQLKDLPSLLHRGVALLATCRALSIVYTIAVGTMAALTWILASVKQGGFPVGSINVGRLWAAILSTSALGCTCPCVCACVSGLCVRFGFHPRCRYCCA